eukprot:2977989-Rhodomonas_salina.4
MRDTESEVFGVGRAGQCQAAGSHHHSPQRRHAHHVSALSPEFVSFVLFLAWSLAEDDDVDVVFSVV